MEDIQGTFQATTFANMRTQIAGLSEAAETRVTAGHVDLGPDLWLSADPEGRAEITCQPAQDGFILRLEEGDSGAWACLGMRFPVAALKGGRHLGVLTALRGGDVVSFMPTLRYFQEAGVRDVPAGMPTILAGGGRDHLAHIPIDPAALEKASVCELNLFFLSNQFVAEFEKIEPVLIF